MPPHRHCIGNYSSKSPLQISFYLLSVALQIIIMKASSSILSFLVIYGSCIATSRADAAPTATTNHHLRHRTKSSSSSSTATHRQLLPNNKNNKKCSILAVQSEGKNGNPDETSFGKLLVE